MDVAQLVLSLFVPTLLALLGYLGHRSIQGIDDEIKDLKKDTQKLKDHHQKLDRTLEFIVAESRVHHNELSNKITNFKTQILEVKAEQKEHELKQLKTDETQGKILIILNKVVTELKKPQK